VELFADLLKILLPAGLVMYAMYLTLRSFTQKEIQQLEAERHIKLADLQSKKLEVELKNKEQILPIRLQAYERMCLFLERISPAQLIPRVNNPEFSVGLYHQILLQEIRNEFGHNLSQQMYISNEAWEITKKAMEEMIVLVNNSTLGLNEEMSGVELSIKILTHSRELNLNPSADALDFLKAEMREQFF
jgi:hypothetical protein